MKRRIAILLAVMMMLLPVTAWATEDQEERIEPEGPIILLKADADHASGDKSLIRLNLALANSLAQDIYNVTFTLEDPDDAIVNEDEIRGSLDNFFSKTVKSYQFILRSETLTEEGEKTLLLHLNGDGFSQTLPIRLYIGPKGLTGQLYSPVPRAPQAVEKNADGKTVFQLANKSGNKIENIKIKAVSLNEALTLKKDRWEFSEIPERRFEKLEVPFSVGEPDRGDYLVFYLDMEYDINGVHYRQWQYRILDPAPISEDLGDSSNWNREQMRRAASGEIPPSGGDIPDQSGPSGGQSSGEPDTPSGGETIGQGNTGDNSGWSGGEIGGSSGMRNKPKLIISRYNFSEKPITAGETFDMELTFFNTNASKGVQNIKIFLTSDEVTSPEGQQVSSGGSVFTPVDSSNTFYIDYIGPKATTSKTITLSADVTAAAKNYTMVANFEYEDGEGNEFTAKELIGIPVIQKSRLTTSEVLLPEMMFALEPGSVGIDFYNTGKVTLYNMFVNVEGDFKTDNQTQYFVGNFTSGSQDHYEASVTLEEPGTLEGKIVFTYEDAAGNPQREEKEFKIPVEEPMMPPEGEMGIDGEMMPPMPESKPIYKKPVLYIVLAVVVVAIIFWKKHKTKQQEDDLKIDE